MGSAVEVEHLAIMIGVDNICRFIRLVSEATFQICQGAEFPERVLATSWHVQPSHMGRSFCIHGLARPPALLPVLYIM